MAGQAKSPPLKRIGATGRSEVGGGFARAQVSEIQRARLLTAIVEVACERGGGDVAVAHVVERCGVSRRTFYEIFEDHDDCFLAAFEEAILYACRYVSDRCDDTGAWAERIRCALEALLRFLEEEPLLGRFSVLESLSGGAKTLERRRGVVEEMIAVVDAGRREANVDAAVTVVTAEGVVGGVLSVLQGHMARGESGGFLKLINPFMSMIVLPYLGPVAAREELERPTVKVRRRKPSVSLNQLKDLDMRLTYRTVRVLAAVAANPGCSNRAIGRASETADQGQISKLLARLERLRLVKNGCVGSGRGDPNAWTLTERGEEVHSAIAAQAT
jgi:AcrR family transcriptional regulator